MVLNVITYYCVLASRFLIFLSSAFRFLSASASDLNADASSSESDFSGHCVLASLERRILLEWDTFSYSYLFSLHQTQTQPYLLPRLSASVFFILDFICSSLLFSLLGSVDFFSSRLFLLAITFSALFLGPFSSLPFLSSLRLIF
ncbi:unnamed protein product [Haemonchus placei]|uniref:Secreted protein n=1 Tax=Haemonchus placei TaxID=6290 RepID=A0A0N4VW90_HAEPC|nr:unnamed protein product [Haemonchus placei]